MEEVEDIGVSELGTQEYWDKHYQHEIKNFENHGDIGDVWFGEDIVDRTIKWIQKTAAIKNDSKILDVGCGNGMFLIELSREGYSNLNGVDYCDSAIKLAQSIADKSGCNIKYWTCDILKDLEGTFDVIHDKGTFDAVSLSQNSAQDKIMYLKNIHKTLNINGYFVITSCNWTKEELDVQFKEYFNCFEVIPTPQFKFGGKIGSVVTSVVYKKIIT